MNGRPAFHNASKNKADRRILGKIEIPKNDDKGVLIAAELLQKTRFSSSGFQRKSGTQVLVSGLRL